MVKRVVGVRERLRLVAGDGGAAAEGIVGGGALFGVIDVGESFFDKIADGVVNEIGDAGESVAALGNLQRSVAGIVAEVTLDALAGNCGRDTAQVVIIGGAGGLITEGIRRRAADFAPEEVVGEGLHFLAE